MNADLPLADYKTELRRAMAYVVNQEPTAVFLGYGVRRGRAMGTLAGIAEENLLEMPVAENLMMGAALGLALAGTLPVVFIERMDFLLNAADALVNHVDKLERISHGQFVPRVLIRCVVGNREKPLFTGVTHTQDFTPAFGQMLSMPVFSMHTPQQVRTCWEVAVESRRSALLVEYKDLL